MKPNEIRIDSEIALAEHIRDLQKRFYESHYLITTMRKGKQHNHREQNA